MAVQNQLLQFCIIVAALVVAALMIISQSESKVVRKLLGFFVLLATLGLAGVLITASSLSYVDRSFKSIPGKSSRADVKQILSSFREIPASADSIPNDMLKSYPDAARYQVFEYRFYVPALAIHVAYDQKGKVKVLIPSYE